MTNPFQQGFTGPHGETYIPVSVPSNNPNSTRNSSSSSQRRLSYASVVSGSGARPPRPGTFSHLLNPDDGPPSGGAYYEVHQHGASAPTPYYPQIRWLPSVPQQHTERNRSTRRTVAGGSAAATAGSASASTDMDRNGGGARAGGVADGTMSRPHHGTGLPLFSRAFDMFMNRDPIVLDEPRAPNISSTGFLSPSYLRGSVYLERLEEAHRARIQAYREGQAAAAAAAAAAAQSQVPSVHHHHHQSASGSGSGLGPVKLPSGSYRGVSLQLVERPPSFGDEEGVDTDCDGRELGALPSRWNREDKYGGLEITPDGYEVKYAGQKSAGEREHESCAIRADHYMPQQCGVYYFEVMILHRKREDTSIGIGFSSKNVSLSRAPGWEPESWGYHGDDGHVFAAQNVGKSYGPKFGPGDTIGCLVNFRLGHALFTKNGHEIGIAFRDISFQDVKGKLYPTVGLKRPGDHIVANFGQSPFLFDIDGYVKKQRSMILDRIQEADTSRLCPPYRETELIQQLFLQHDGYVETARALAGELHTEKKALSLKGAEVDDINVKDDEDANNRQLIRRAILEGDIDRALKCTDAFYPQVLKENEQVYFRLRCRKFIEMIRQEAELNLTAERRGAKQPQRVPYDGDDEEMTEADDDDNDDMETEDGDAVGSSGSTLGKLPQEALAYGQELRTEFQGRHGREGSRHLDEIFALIAYQNPLKVKDVAHLLDRTGRVAVAEELNSAILSSLGKSSRAAFETLYAQTCVLLRDLRQDGGDGAFITVQSVIDDIPKPSLA